MNLNRSALTAYVVGSLPNVKDYIHKDRQTLMEERRRRLFANEEDNIN
jgi:kelch-like protein 10